MANFFLQRVHASALARLYVCKKGERQWKYSGMYGTATICTEADLRMACAHFIRIVDLDGFNPVDSTHIFYIFFGILLNFFSFFFIQEFIGDSATRTIS